MGDSDSVRFSDCANIEGMTLTHHLNQMKLSSSITAAAVIGVSLIGMPIPAHADLGGADITGPSGDTSTGRTYKARCGESKKKCKVSFKEEKLIVNNSGGIYRDQFINVVRKRECTQRSILLPWVTSCFENQYDISFTITYNNDQDNRRSALISFMPRYFGTGATDRAREFERDLQVWMEDVMRPIGPSIKIEEPRKMPLSRRPLATKTKASCRPPLSDYDCDWEKYLEANPNVKAWSIANPIMADKERIKFEQAQ
jgi:hypothetical protein